VELLLGSTIENYFKAFRKVLRLARKAQLINRETINDLFEDLHIAAKKAKRSFLTNEEIKTWKSFRFAGEEKHLERDRDIFLLQIYTGYYYKDMVGLKKEHLVKDHEHGYLILGQRSKNDEQTMIISEPDVQWWLNQRGYDYTYMNITDQAAMINELRRLGNDKAVLVTTINKGYRKPDNRKHPHSWSIADSEQTINWLQSLK
jgi:hypothetical protein